MTDDTVYTLVASTNRGRYALDDPEQGRDLTGGDSIAILLAGQWIEGSIEHAGNLYATENTAYPRNLKSGYYFASSEGICGLCSGMKVRLL